MPVEPLELKGKPEPVPAYRLLSVTAAATSTGPASRPLVGRAREIAALDADFRRSVAGPEGRLITLFGQAGVGKSRLIEEFVNSLDDEATVLRGRCLSYGDGITFCPLAEVLRQAAGIVPEDSEEDARIKLKSCFGEQLADATSRIESGMGLSQDLYGKDELFWGVRAVLEELARRRPLVVVFDDIHWAEPTFLDLIEDILDASLGVPLLLVCAARHELREDRPGFAAGRRTASQIDLAELSRTESGRVVRNLLGEASLPKPLEQRILGLAEGNPLFIEQMLSMLIDDGRLREQAGRWVFSGTADVVSVPGNVSSLLGARLDRLGPTELRVVESASVIGLEFSTSALSVLLEESVAEADLERALAGLCSKQLIRRAEPGEADDFHFSHILVRDTAYARLLKRTRARLHERFAAWFTGTVGSRLAEYEEIIGYHLEQSFRYRAELGPIDDDGRRLGAEASRHLSSAGRRALVRGDMPAAANLLQRAAALLGEEDPARALLLLDAGEAAVDIGELERAESVLTEAVERALSADDTGTARAAALALLQLRYTTDAHAVQESIGRQESMVELVEQEIPELEAMGEDRALVRAFRLLAQVHGTAGRYADAAAAAERTIRHATAAGDEVTARRFLGLLAISALYGPMPVVEAIATCEEVLARAQDDRKAIALTELCIGHLEAMRGDFERARLLYRRSRASLGGVRLPPAGRTHVARLVRSSSCSPGIWPPPSRSCARITGVLRRWASATTSRPRQACSPTSSTGRAGTTSRPSSPGSASTLPPPTTSLPSSTGAASAGSSGPGRERSARPRRCSRRRRHSSRPQTSLTCRATGCWISPRSGSWPEPPATPRLSANKRRCSSSARETSSRPEEHASSPSACARRQPPRRASHEGGLVVLRRLSMLPNDLDRETFLVAVTGNSMSSAEADAFVTRRLIADPPADPDG